MIANIRAGLGHVLATAPQLPTIDRWRALVRYIVSQIGSVLNVVITPKRQIRIDL
jgi:hypothetical protein